MLLPLQPGARVQGPRKVEAAALIPSGQPHTVPLLSTSNAVDSGREVLDPKEECFSEGRCLWATEMAPSAGEEEGDTAGPELPFPGHNHSRGPFTAQE